MKELVRNFLLMYIYNNKKIVHISCAKLSIEFAISDPSNSSCFP